MRKSPLMKVAQVSEMIDVKEKTIYDWVHKRQIPHLKLGRLVRFDRSEIESWLSTKKRTISKFT